MSVVQPGGGRERGGGGGQRPGRPPGTRQQGQSPRQQGQAGRQQGQSTRPPRSKPNSGGTRTQTKGPQTPTGQKYATSNRGKGRRNVPVKAAQPRRLSPAMITVGAIGVVVIVVVALVIVRVTTGGGSSNSVAPVNVPADPQVVAQVTGVPVSVQQAVGLPTAGTGSFLSVPQVVSGQKPLTYDGKPGALFIGAEFCPYCAAERWAIIMAFSRFGTFSGLKETNSSPWDVYPDTATFSFYGASYSSNYLVFKPIEAESDATGANDAGVHELMPLTSAESNLWDKWDTHFGATTNGQPGFPFVDIGNKVFVVGPTYNPQVLAGYNQQEIAGMLSNPKSPVTQSIVGSANYLTAGICSITGQQPSSVCSVPVITQASKSMGLS
jgi:Domain of unknown function (DUF929)